MRSTIYEALHFLWSGWIDLHPGRAIRKEMEQAGIALIHIPKNAGTAISKSLYSDAPAHRTWRWYRGINALTVAVVRDPIERFLSAYDYLRSGGGSLNDRLMSRLYLSDDVNTFVRHLDRSRRLRSYYHFQTQAHFVTHRSQPMVDELVPYERLNARFPKLERVNPTRGERTQKEHLSLESIATLRRIYAKDFELVRLAASSTLPHEG